LRGGGVIPFYDPNLTTYGCLEAETVGLAADAFN